MRLVGTDMSERSVGRHLCDAFHLVPAGSDPGLRRPRCATVAEREGAVAILPQSSFDLEGLAGALDRFDGIAVLVSPPDAIHRSNDKAESYAFLHRLGLPAPEFRRVRGAARGRGGGARARLPGAARSASSRCSRRARAASASSTRRSTAPTSCCASGPGSVSMLLEDARRDPRLGRRPHGAARDGARDRPGADDRRDRERPRDRARPPEDARGDARRARDVLRDARRRRR